MTWSKSRVTLLATIAAITAAAACADVVTSPSEPAAIELAPFAAPAIVVGDTLRDIDGKIAPIQAIVRNLQGSIIATAPIRYVYADASRDTSLFVDSVSGLVVALKPLGLIASGAAKPTQATSARLAARLGGSLQILRTIALTTRPDSVDRTSALSLDTLRAALPDTVTGITRNTSVALSVTVRHVERVDSTSMVSNWLVRFEVLQPANASNDSLSKAYLVDDQGHASPIDTTDGSGLASRNVRVRPSMFPTGTAVDSVIVRATVTYKGQSVKGSPIRFSVPVKKSS